MTRNVFGGNIYENLLGIAYGDQWEKPLYIYELNLTETSIRTYVERMQCIIDSKQEEKFTRLTDRGATVIKVPENANFTILFIVKIINVHPENVKENMHWTLF